MAKPLGAKLANFTRDKIFQSIHNNTLIYNTSWEDPAIDRQLLDLGPTSRVLMITSAGDNALDYLLDRPGEVHCVDVNSRQNALLELKRAVIKYGEYEDLFRMFGEGHHPGVRKLYKEKLRAHLPEYARKYWDKKIKFFDNEGLKNSFYYCGGAGTVAWLFGLYLRIHKGLNTRIARLLDSKSLEEQMEAYDEIEPILWNAALRWVLRRHITMAIMGVPRPQRDLIMQNYPGGLLGFLQDRMRRVFTELPVRSNYFYRVYVKGSYSRECAPEYLRENNFETLKETVDRLHINTTSIAEYLKANPRPYTHFILLDHQDWLANAHPEALREEWERILENAGEGAQILMRSAGPEVDFLPDIALQAVRFHPERTSPLNERCRVGTYWSLHLGTISSPRPASELS